MVKSFKNKNRHSKHEVDEMEYDSVNNKVPDNYLWESPKSKWDQGFIEFDIHKPTSISGVFHFLFKFGDLNVFHGYYNSKYFICFSINNNSGKQLTSNNLFLNSNKSNVKIYYNNNNNYQVEYLNSTKKPLIKDIVW